MALGHGLPCCPPATQPAPATARHCVRGLRNRLSWPPCPVTNRASRLLLTWPQLRADDVLKVAGLGQGWSYIG